MTMPNVERYRTPHKLGRPVLSPSGIPGAFDAQAVDTPFVFRHGDEYKMMHIGFDGVGYQTAIARSRDLVTWEHEAVVLAADAQGTRWDSANAAGAWILRDDDLDAVPALRKWRGRYWMLYHSYPGSGYEAGPAGIGLASTDDETLRNWTRHPDPILTADDGAEWERGGLYKECVVERDGVFFLFYNAKNRVDEGAGEIWTEQIGVATSTDLVTWTRHAGNPVLRVTPGSWDSRFIADPVVLRDGDTWVMFYYGFDGRHAQDGIAFSTDLVTWRKADGPLLGHGGPEDIDATHAHKPSVVRVDGVLYHFYCAVRPARSGGGAERTITVATSEPLRAVDG